MSRRLQLGMIAPGFYPEVVPDFYPAQAYVAQPHLGADELRLMMFSPEDVPFLLRRVPTTEERPAIPPLPPSRLASLFLTSRYGDDVLSNQLDQMLMHFEAGNTGLAQLAAEASDLGFGDIPPQEVAGRIREALQRRTHKRVREYADFVLKRGDLWGSIAVFGSNVADIRYRLVAPICGLAVVERRDTGHGDNRLVWAVLRRKDGGVGKAAVMGVFEAVMQARTKDGY